MDLDALTDEREKVFVGAGNQDVAADIRGPSRYLQPSLWQSGRRPQIRSTLPDRKAFIIERVARQFDLMVEWGLLPSGRLAL